MMQPHNSLTVTAVGTIQCSWCKAEWIGRVEDGHDDPCCMMWVLRWDPHPPHTPVG